MPTNSDAFEIRLKPDAVARMAAAADEAGEQLRPGHHGHPNVSGLLGGLRNGVPTDVSNREGYAPANKTLGRIACLHAKRRGIPWYEALGELCDEPEGDDDTATRVAA